MVLTYQDIFNIIQILVKQSGQKIVSIYEINDYFKKHFHSDIPYKQFHFKTLSAFLQSFHGLKFNKSTHGIYFSLRINKKPIPAVFHDLFAALIKDNKSEIIISNLFNEFNKKHFNKYNLNDYDHDELVDFLTKSFKNVTLKDNNLVPKINTTNIEEVDDRTTVANVFQASKEAIEELNDVMTLYVVEHLPKSVLNIQNINKDYVPPGFQMKYQWLSYSNPNQLIPIMVYEMFDLSKFWIQFVVDDIYDDFNALLVDMKSYYDESNRFELMNVEYQYLVPSFICVIYFEKNIKSMKKKSKTKKIDPLLTPRQYHRAKIIRQIDKDEYHCFFFDYGTHRRIHRKHILYMYKRFAQHPIQAIRARLDDVRPINKNSMWPLKSIDYFKKWLASKSHMYAKIVNKNRKGKFFSILLYNENNDNYDKSISSLLIQNELAADVKTVYQSDNISLCVPNVYLYPTFFEIENNIYPSARKYHRLLRNSLLINYIFYFYLNCITIKNYLELMEEAQAFLTSGPYIGN